MMKKRIVVAVALVVALLCLYRGVRHAMPDQRPAPPDEVPNHPDKPAPLAIHRPDQLNQFYLPGVVIDGLPLETALAKLRTVYEDVCRESGEVPVPLTFIVPAEAKRLLTVTTGNRQLDGAIHLLAAMSGLKVSRTGSEYVFTVPGETAETVKKEFRTPPDYFAVPTSEGDHPFSGRAKSHDWLLPADYFGNRGVTLDPGTRLAFSDTGTLLLETTSAADEVAISGLIEVAAGEMSLEHAINARMFDIPPGIEWTTPDPPQLDSAHAEKLMRQLEQIDGDVNPLTPLDFIAKSGYPSKIEIAHGLARATVNLQSFPYGFGHRIDLNWQESVYESEIGPSSSKTTDRPSISDSSFTRDGNTRIHVRTHSDASRSVLMITAMLVDAKGRRVHPE